MLEFLQECIAGPNLFATILLCLMLAYWLFVIFGVLGLETFDLDVDAEIEVGGVDTGAEASFDFGDILRFFHLGEVPVMIFVSFFSVFFWIATITTNHYLNDELNFVVMFWYIGPCSLAALFLTKLVIMPMVPLFRTGGSPAKSREKLIGEKAVVSTKELNDKFGQIKIHQDGPPIVLNARVENGHELMKGDVVEIIRHVAEGDLYIVKLTKWEND